MHINVHTCTSQAGYSGLEAAATPANHSYLHRGLVLALSAGDEGAEAASDGSAC